MVLDFAWQWTWKEEELHKHYIWSSRSLYSEKKYEHMKQPEETTQYTKDMDQRVLVR
jgi:hypothetical protein